VCTNAAKIIEHNYFSGLSTRWSACQYHIFSEFANLLELLISYRCTGDMNLHLSEHTHSDYKKLTEILNSFGMVQIISTPTHISGGLLDVVIVRTDQAIPNCLVHSPEILDHSLLEIFLPYSPPTVAFVQSECRSWKNLDKITFRTKLFTSVLCDSTYLSSDVT